MEYLFNPGDRVRLKPQFRESHGKDYNKYGTYLTVTKSQVHKDGRGLFQHEKQEKLTEWVFQDFFELYRPSLDWRTATQEQQKDFLRKVTGALYANPDLCDQISELINKK
jgi:hypothetical protein